MSLRTCLLLFWAVTREVGGVVYCGGSGVSVDIINTTVTGLINSNLPGELNYGNNRHCVWRLSAPTGTRVQLEVKLSDIQWAPADVAVCTDGYDYMKIENIFPNSSTSNIIAWCGRTNPGSVVSTTNGVRVTFHTNHQNIYEYRGIQLEYRAFDGCPSGWSEFNGHCYLLHPAQLTWKQAQLHCGYSQANLVTVTTKAESEFVHRSVFDSGSISAKSRHVLLDECCGNRDNLLWLIAKSSSHRTWIGLNDIKKEGKYTWIDNTIPIFSGWPADHKAQNDRDCVSVASGGLWVEERCSELDERRFVCEMIKGGVTRVFPVPMTNSDKGGDEGLPVWFQWQALVISLVAIVIIAVLVFLVVIWKKKQKRNESVECVYENRAVEDHASPSDGATHQSVSGDREHGTSLVSDVGDSHEHSNLSVSLHPKPAVRPAMYSPPSYDEASRQSGDGTHIHMHVHLPYVKTTPM